ASSATANSVGSEATESQYMNPAMTTNATIIDTVPSTPEFPFAMFSSLRPRCEGLRVGPLDEFDQRHLGGIPLSVPQFEDPGIPARTLLEPRADLVEQLSEDGAVLDLPLRHPSRM